MRVSVALATYNGERFLAEQLASIARQTWQPWELVVCDDGSTDRTVEVARGFAHTARFPVRLHENPRRLGYADNFLRAASLCEGDLVAFCDQDDIWSEHKLERMVQALTAVGGAVLAVHRVEVVDEALRPLGYAHFSDFKGYQVRPPLASDPWYIPPGCAMVFSRRLVSDLPWQRRPTNFWRGHGPLAHDQWIYFLANAVGSIVYVPEVLIKYRRHGGTTTPYGTPPPRLQAVKLVLEAGAEKYERFHRFAREYGEFLGELAGGCSGPLREKLAAAARFYQQLSRALQDRAALYRASFARRVLLLARMAGYGGYGALARGGRSWRPFAKDMLVATGLWQLAATHGAGRPGTAR